MNICSRGYLMPDPDILDCILANSLVRFFDPEGSLSATTVVVLVVTRFRKMPNALLIRNGKLRNFAHIRDIIPDKSTVLDFLPDGATFRVCSTFRTCFFKICLRLSASYFVGGFVVDLAK